MAKGLEQGLVQGEVRLLLGQMEERFGAVPPRIRSRMADLTPEQLDAAGRRIFKAERIENRFTWPK